MAMFSTTYKNNQRIVSGNTPVFNDDVVLLCDTSIAPVTINLGDIAIDYWNTIWKLYVVDNSNNAITNNIVINAGAGQTINGFSSLTINTNGGQALIRVSSNSSFIAELSTGGNANLTVKDEGVTVVAGVTILNFIGAVVNVTTPMAGEADVTIDALGYQILSNSALLSLISAGTLNIGWTYIVNNVTNANTFVAVQAIATNAVQNYGAGYFLNADYQAVGNYSGVSGYVSQTGIWKGGSASYVVGDVCIWNNYHYKNITGSNSSTTPNSDTTNWVLLTKSATNGYIIAVDYVIYDVVTNIVRKRIDSKNNEVDYTNGNISFDYFQWGRNQVTYNKVLNGSLFGAVNSPCNFTGNFLVNSQITDYTPALITGGSIDKNILTNSQITIQSNQGEVSYNNLDSGSYFSIQSIINVGGAISPTINYNNFKENSYISLNTLQDASITYNNFYSESYILTVGSVIISNSSLDRNNFSSVSYLRILNSVTSCSIYESNVEGRSYISITGAYSGNVRNNVLSVNSYLVLNTGIVGADCSGNRLSAFSYITIGAHSGQIDNNFVTNLSNIQITTNYVGSYVSQNRLENNSSLILTTGGEITGQTNATIQYNSIDNTILSINNILGNLENNQITNSTLAITTANNSFNENQITNSTLAITTASNSFNENQFIDSNFQITTLSGVFNYNQIIKGDLQPITISGTFQNNQIAYSSLSGTTMSGTFNYNQIEYSSFSITTIGGTFNYNKISISAFTITTIYANANFNNNLIGNTSLTITNINASANFNNNSIDNGISINIGTLNSDFTYNQINSSGITVTTFNGAFNYNILNISNVSITTNSGNFLQNEISNSTIGIGINADFTFNNIVSGSSIAIATNNGVFNNNYFTNGIIGITTLSGNFTYNQINSSMVAFIDCIGNATNNNIFNSQNIAIETNNFAFNFNEIFDSVISIVDNYDFSSNNLTSATISIQTNNGSITNNTINNSQFYISSSIDVNSSVQTNNLYGSKIRIDSACTTLIISGCELNNGAYLHLLGINTNCSYQNIAIKNNGLIETGIFTNCSFSNCELIGGITISLGNLIGSTFTNKSYRTGYSNWEAQLDLSDTDIFIGTTVTVPAVLGTYVGSYTFINCASQNISSIVNLTTNHPITFTVGDGSVRVAKVNVSTAVANNIVGLIYLNLIGSIYTYRSSISDNFVVQKMATGLGCLSLFQENIYV